MAPLDLPRYWERLWESLRPPLAVACPDRPSCEGSECAACRNCEIHCRCSEDGDGGSY